MRQCVLCGEELHADEHKVCSLCDPDGNLNYRGVTNAGKTKRDIREQKRFKKDSEARDDY